MGCSLINSLLSDPISPTRDVVAIFARQIIYVIHFCIQDTLSPRAALGLPAVQPLGRVRRASKGILHTVSTYKPIIIFQKLK